MAEGNAQTRTLHRALRICGSVERLAGALGCDVERLKRWISGEELTPSDVYLRALDIVSGTRPG